MPKTAPPLAARSHPVDADAPAWPSPGIAAAAYFLLSLVFFLPAFAPGRQVFGTDYLAGGYMFYQFVGERLAAGELPKWVPYVYGGMPLAANPGSTYHPIHFLADLILPTGYVLAAVFVIHFWLAGVGGYLLASELGCRRWIAFLAGIAYQFTGIVMSWVYAGHDGRIMVATVAPLFLFFLHRGIRTERLAPFAGAAATLGLALLSFQIQNSYYLLLAAAIWSVFCLIHFGLHRRPGALARTVGLGLGAVAFGFLLASVNFLPFLDYVPESPRGSAEGRGYEFSTSFSMPEGELLSLAVPEHHGISVYDPETQRPLFPEYRGENAFKLHTEYVGAFVIVMLALGLYFSRRNAYWRFFLGLSLFGLTVALGGNTPIYRIYFELFPGTKQFRAPSLIFFVVSLSLVVMAALTLEQVARVREAARARRGGAEAGEPRPELAGWVAAGVAALALAGAMLTAGSGSGPAGAPTVSEGWMRFALMAGVVAGALWLWTAGRISTAMVAVGLWLITLVDLWVMDRKFFHTVPGPDVTFAADDVVAFLEAQPGEFRVWAFPIPQAWGRGGPNGGNYPMIFDLEQAGGEHPNPLRRWVEYIGAGTQTYTDWHNFLAEPAVVGTPDGNQAIAFRSTPGFLEAANVRYVISLAPLQHPALREVHRGSALVYENTQAMPRAYLVEQTQRVPEGQALAAMRSRPWNPAETAFVAGETELNPTGGPLQGSAEIAEYAPDRVTVRTRANRAALLVLADNFYEGWVATVNGRAAPVLLANHTFRGVVVPEGESEVVFEYRPGDLIAGFWIYLGGMALLAAYGGWLALRATRERRLARSTE